MFASNTLHTKARHGRRAALAALAVARLYDDEETTVSIFDDAFETTALVEQPIPSNVVPFRRASALTPRPTLLAA